MPGLEGGEEVNVLMACLGGVLSYWARFLRSSLLG